jgi:rsbT co-antagonist protein RsbR
MPTLHELLKQNEPQILDRGLELAKAIPFYARMNRDELIKRIQPLLAAFERDLENESVTHYSENLRQLSYQRAQQNVPLVTIQQAVMLVNQAIIDTFMEVIEDANVKIDALRRCFTIGETGIIALYEGYEQANNDIIESQKSALQELSTPIIPIYEGILVLPLVGSVDSDRAGRIMEGLLEGINANNADVVIMDITGVPVIDTGVANYLLQAARAARLLGSQVVLVGIGAEIAQTIVQLGIDLTGIVTRSNLQTGIEYALALRDLAIGPASMLTSA